MRKGFLATVLKIPGNIGIQRGSRPGQHYAKSEAMIPLICGI